MENAICGQDWDLRSSNNSQQFKNSESQKIAKKISGHCLMAVARMMEEMGWERKESTIVEMVSW